MSQIVFAIITMFAYIYRMFIIGLACYLTIKTNNNSWLWLLVLLIFVPNYECKHASREGEK